MRIDTQAGHYHWFICKDCGGYSGGALHLNGKNLFAPPNDSESMKYIACPFCGSVGNMRLSTCLESTEDESEQREFSTDP